MSHEGAGVEKEQLNFDSKVPRFHGVQCQKAKVFLKKGVEKVTFQQLCIWNVQDKKFVECVSIPETCPGWTNTCVCQAYSSRNGDA